MTILDTYTSGAHGGLMTGNQIAITGAIDRSDPDPAMPTNPWRNHIGMLTVCWTDQNGNACRSMAGMIRDSSGRASPSRAWKASLLCLVWVGDPPIADVVQAVYDWVWDRGPAAGWFSVHLIAQPSSEAAPSYRVIGSG